MSLTSVHRLLLLATLAVTALVGVACGSSSRPAPAGNATDRAFVAEMIPHHTSAVAMARVAEQRGRSPFVKQLAADIVRTQTVEIGTMRRRDAALAEGGVKVGELGVPADAMGMDMATGTLRSATRFDPAFLKMMISHHAGAIVMARSELARGKDPALKKLATAVITAQRREIRAMRGHL
jgi:uncharacterized protein (DUF305 family)